MKRKKISRDEGLPNAIPVGMTDLYIQWDMYPVNDRRKSRMLNSRTSPDEATSCEQAVECSWDLNGRFSSCSG